MIYVMSGGTKLFAAIGVTYPEGSILTCTKGSKTLRAKTSTGQWVFSIPEAGDWTVTATDGTNTRSQTVSITAEGQGVSMILNYELALLSSSGLASGYTLNKQSGGTAALSSNQITLTGSNSRDKAYISPMIDCSQFSKMTVTGRKTGAGSAASYIAVGVATALPANNTDTSVSFAASAKFATVNATETLTIDLSGISSECYVCIESFYLTPGVVASIVFE